MKDDELMEKVKQMYKDIEVRKQLSLIGIKTPEMAYRKCKEFAKFLAEVNPEKYGEKTPLYEKFQEDKNLKEILVFTGLDKRGKELSLIFGTEKAQVKGHIAYYRNGKVKLNSELQKKLSKKIDSEFKDVITQEEKEKMLKNISIEELELMAQEGGVDNLRDKQVKELNRENGISSEQEIEVKNKENNTEKTEISSLLGIQDENIKNYMRVRPTELIRKTEGYSLTENQIHDDRGYVTLVQVKSEKATGPDRYYGIQNGRIVLFGYPDTNEDVGRIFDGDTTNYKGRIVTPLRAKESSKEIDIDDGNGESIEIDVNDNPDLCSHEIEKYRKEMEELLMNYSTEMKSAVENGATSTELKEITERYKKGAEVIAEKCDIDDKTFNKVEVQVGDMIEEKTEEYIKENEDGELTGRDPRENIFNKDKRY